jgi:vacuolar iron transporter family protein
MASAAAFTVGAALPLATAFVSPVANLPTIVSAISILKSILRVTFWGAAAMAPTALVGSLFGAVAA